ncbi:hypothetical protein M0P65_05770 [Candidatus Gracilibacteria bacterium]|jgi:hypothetical protein|nr:hypothetical protein [Candidatus Gracilibacteria bacterium]
MPEIQLGHELGEKVFYIKDEQKKEGIITFRGQRKEDQKILYFVQKPEEDGNSSHGDWIEEEYINSLHNH